MSDTVIKVENLSKSYQIRHQTGERYTALRDVLANGVKGMGNRLLGRTASASSATDASREEFWALNDVSFEIKQGERVGIIGRNGAGKSTLLKILSRITEPTKGRIHIKGRVASLLEVGTGFHPELTGRENIYLNGAILGMSREEIHRKFDEIVTFAEVEKFLDTPVKRYSSGMYVRLAFSVAAHLETDVLVVDEVLAVGDAIFQKKCIGKMENVAEQGRTLLFVSHNLGTILSLCPTTMLIEGGRLALQGITQNIIEQYTIKSTSVNESIRLDKRIDRTGSREATLTSIEVKGGDNNEIIYCDSRLEIFIGYESTKNLEGITFAIGIFDYMGAEIYFISSDSRTEFPESLPSKGIVRCLTGPINLTPGRCYINVALIRGGVFQNSELVDYVQNAIGFNVEANDFYGTGLLPPRNWSLCLLPNRWILMNDPKSQ